MGVDILVIIISTLLSAFFSGMEIAFVSANKMHIELEKKNEGFIARVFSKLTQKPSKFITTMLVGNNIALVVYSIFMGDYIVQFLDLNPFLTLLVQTSISTVIILVFAEFLPKAIFQIYADECLRIFAIPAYVFYIVFHYISNFITFISDFLLKVLFNAPTDEKKTSFSKAELENYISKQVENSDNKEMDSEIQIFQNALDFKSVKAREVMIPRTEILAVDINESIEEVLKLFVDHGYSKVLIYKGNLDNIIGYVHAFDMFKKPKRLHSVLRTIEFIPESILINDVLNILTKKKRSLAVVLDEYGGTSGMLTVEDIIEELFGEIEDEHDTVKLKEKELEANEYQLSARHEVDYLNETYGFNLPEDEAYETLGGFIVYHSESIPQKGESVLIENFNFKIIKSTSTKIEEVILKIENTNE